MRRADACHIGNVFHQVNAALQLAHGAFHLGVTLVADHDELIAFFSQLGHFHMHFGHQRTGGIKNLETTCTRLLLNRLADAVGAEHQRGTGRHVVQFFNEDRALGFQVIYHIGVVHDLMAHINRPSELVQRALHDFNGAVHTGTEAAWLGQKNFLRLDGRGAHKTPIS